MDEVRRITMTNALAFSGNLMSEIAARLAQLQIGPPPPPQWPPGVLLPFPWVRLVGSRALISGHGPIRADGSLARPLGKVGLEVSEAEAYQAARLTGLSILGSLRRQLSDLDRIIAWTRVFGPEVGARARSAVGLASLPFDIPVEIEGEVVLR
jgi:hypothetical protein